MSPVQGTALAALLACALFAGCAQTSPAPTFPSDFVPAASALPEGWEIAGSDSPAAAYALHGIYGAPPMLAQNPAYVNDIYRRGDGNVTPPSRIYMEILDRVAEHGDSIAVSALEFATMADADKAAATPPPTNPHHGKCGQDGGAAQVLRLGVHFIFVSGRAADDNAVTNATAPANAAVAVIAKALADRTGAVVLCQQDAGVY